MHCAHICEKYCLLLSIRVVFLPREAVKVRSIDWHVHNYSVLFVLHWEVNLTNTYFFGYKPVQPMTNVTQYAHMYIILHKRYIITTTWGNLTYIDGSAYTYSSAQITGNSTMVIYGTDSCQFTDALMLCYKCRWDSWMWASAVTRSKLSHPFTACLMLDRAPRMHMIADRSKEKLRWVRIQLSVDE